MKRYCERQHVSDATECTGQTLLGIRRPGLHCPRCGLLTKEVGRLDQLPERLLKTLAEIHTGKHSKAVAHALGVSDETLKVYASHLLTALGCENRIGLALIWERHLADLERWKKVERIA